MAFTTDISRQTNSYCRNVSIRNSLSGSAGDCVSTIHRRQERTEEKKLPLKITQAHQLAAGRKKRAEPPCQHVSRMTNTHKHRESAHACRTGAGQRSASKIKIKTHKHTMGRAGWVTALFRISADLRTCVCACVCT